MSKPSRRGSEALRLTGWKRQEIRARYLRAHPLCVDCEAAGRVTAAVELDHVIPLAKGGTWEWSNLAGRCTPCHAAKTRLERNLGVKGCDEFGIPLDQNHPWNK